MKLTEARQIVAMNGVVGLNEVAAWELEADGEYVPALDALATRDDPSALLDFKNAVQKNPGRVAQVLFGKTDGLRMPDIMRAVKLLGVYADYAASAMRYRAQGKGDLAMKLERDAERAYNQLPAFARW